MAHLPYHPAAGFGELLPGFFVVPQNPIVDTKDEARYPTYFASSGPGIKYVPKIAELLPNRFAVPSNPLVATLRAGMANALSGCCCDGGGGSGGAAPDDTAAGYVNGVPVVGGDGVAGMLGNVDWMTIALAVGAGYVLFGRR